MGSTTREVLSRAKAMAKGAKINLLQFVLDKHKLFMHRCVVYMYVFIVAYRDSPLMVM